MKKLINAILASMFVFAVLVAVPAYTDFIDNPGMADTNGVKLPQAVLSWE